MTLIADIGRDSPIIRITDANSSALYLLYNCPMYGERKHSNA